nr:MAG TPA: hypothetical protein [Caudoviricetes sp.]
MKKIIAKNFYKILIFLIIINVISIFLKVEKSLKILEVLISALLFAVSYIIHEECMNEIGAKVLDIENIMRDELDKNLSEKEIQEIYNNEHNKYFNKGLES